MKKILILGGAGFIGYNLALYLKNKDYFVVCIDDVQSDDSRLRFSLLTEKNIPVFIKESIKLTREEVLAYDVIIDLAATPRVQRSFYDPVDTAYNNCLSVSKMMYLLQNGGKKYIYSSSSTAKTLMSPYGVQKKFAEDLIKLYATKKNINAHVLRLHSVYGPKMSYNEKDLLLIPALIKNLASPIPLLSQFKLYGDGENKRDFTYVDDVCKVFEAVIETDVITNGEPVDVGAGKPHTVNHIINLVETISNRKIEMENLQARIEQKESMADNTLLKQYYNINNNDFIDIEEGLRKTIESLK